MSQVCGEGFPGIGYSPAKALETRSAGEIPDVEGAGSGGMDRWGTLSNLGLVTWSLRKGDLEPRP